MTKNVKLEDICKDYGHLAPQYDTRWRPFLDATHGWVTHHWPKNSQSVLDLGCGTGRMLSHIHTEHTHVTLHGIDASEDMLKIARKTLPDAELRQDDITGLKNITETYDVVTSVNVLHHLNAPQAHIGSLKRLCNENGTIFLSDFAIDTVLLKIMDKSWQLLQPSYHKAFSSSALLDMITAEGGLSVTNKAVLAPDRFWRIQIYKITKRKSGNAGA